MPPAGHGVAQRAGGANTPAGAAAQAFDVEIDQFFGLAAEIHIVAVGEPGRDQPENQGVESDGGKARLHALRQLSALDGVAYGLLRTIHAALLYSKDAVTHPRHFSQVLALM